MTFRTVDAAANDREFVSVSSREILSTNTALSGSLRKALALMVPAVAAGALFLSADAIAQVAPNTLPSGSTVQAGSVTITQPDANKLQINQGSDKAIIDWRSYSIGSQGWVNYTMPGRGSISLNRVTGGDLSYIMGKLTANGTVMLVNPNGILFGAGAQVDVGGLVATTANIRNDDFMAGRMNFTQPGNPGASVINEGSITIKDAGVAAFVAPGVANRGIIEANLGTVSLAAGNTFTLDLYGDGLVKVAVTDPVTVAALGEGKALVENSGTIKADGGKVLLSAAAAKGVVDQVINMDGVIQARRVSQSADGTIILDGGDNGTVNVAGKLDTSATATGVDAGKITVTGEKVHVRATARIEATAKVGKGGTVKIGGDYKGQGTTRQAKIVVIDAGALINVSATDAGDGGLAVVWSTDTTNFNGIIMAKGGELAGNGGLVETSGANLYIGPDALVTTLAANGLGGTWLLDPAIVNVSGAADSACGTATSNVTCTINTTTLLTGLTNNAEVVIAANNSTGDGPLVDFQANFTYNGPNKLVIDVGTSSTFGEIEISNGIVVTLSHLELRSPRTSTSSSGVRLDFTDANGQLNVTTLTLAATLGGDTWQGTLPTTVNVIKNPNDGSLPGGSIQQGIDLVQANGTVNVGAGTFNETLTIGKSLTLNGANAAIPAQGARVTETVLGPNSPAFIANEQVITIDGGVDNVVIAGFTINGFDGSTSFLVPNPADGANRAAVGIGNSGNLGNGIQIKNNIFTNLELRGIDLDGPSGASAATGLVISGNAFQAMGAQALGVPFSATNAVRLTDNVFGSVANNTVDTSVTTAFVVRDVDYSGATPRTLVFTDNNVTVPSPNVNPLTLPGSAYLFDNIDTSTGSYVISGGTLAVGALQTGIKVQDSNRIDLGVSGVTIQGGLFGIHVVDSHGILTVTGGSITGDTIAFIPTMLNAILIEPGMNTVTLQGGLTISTILGSGVSLSDLAASDFTSNGVNYVGILGNAIDFGSQIVPSTVTITNNFFSLIGGNAIRLADFADTATVSITDNSIAGVGLNGILLTNFSGAATHNIIIAGNTVTGVLLGDGIRLESFSAPANVTLVGNQVSLVALGSGIVLDGFTAGATVQASLNAVLGVGGDGIRFANFGNDIGDVNDVTASFNAVIGAAGSGIVFDGFQGVNTTAARFNFVSLVGEDGIRFANYAGLNFAGASFNLVLGAGDNGIHFANFTGGNLANAMFNAVIGVGEDGIRFDNFSGASLANAMFNFVTLAGDDGIQFSRFAGINAANAMFNTVALVGDDGIRFDQFAGANLANAMFNIVLGAGDDGIQFSRFAGLNVANAMFNIVIGTGDDGIQFDRFIGGNLANAMFNVVALTADDGIVFSRFAGINVANAEFNAVAAVGDDGIQFDRFVGLNFANASFNAVLGAQDNGILFAGFLGLSVANANENVVIGTGNDGIAFRGFLGGQIIRANENFIRLTGGDGIEAKFLAGATLVTVTDNDIRFAGANGIDVGFMLGLNAVNVTGNQIRDVADNGVRVGALLGLNLVNVSQNAIENAGDAGIRLVLIGGASLINVDQNQIDGAATGIDYSFVGNALAFITNNTIGDVGTGMSFTNLGDNALFIGGNTIAASAFGMYFGILQPGNDVLVTLRSNVFNMGPAGTGLYVDNFDAGNPGDPAFVGTYTFDFDTPDATTANVFNGGNEGIHMEGEGLFLVNDTFGFTVFNGTVNNYITLTNGALYQPGLPTLISIANVNFDGLILGPTPSNAQKAIIEARVTHFLDHPPNEAGLFFELIPVNEATQLPEIPNFNLPQWDPNRVFEVKWFEPFKTSFKWLSGGPYNFGTFELDFPLGTVDPNSLSSLGELAPAAGPGSEQAKQLETCTQNFMGNFWAWYQQCGQGAQQ